MDFIHILGLIAVLYAVGWRVNSSRELSKKVAKDIKDGMDVSLCAFNIKTNKLEWAGANSPLWLINNKDLIETKADKQSKTQTDRNVKAFLNKLVEIFGDTPDYFVTSADSATLVICTLISMGDEEPAPRFRIFWGLAVGAVAAVLLYAGGLKALQTASIVAALPFSIVLIMAAFGLFKSLYAEPASSKPEVTTQE